MKTLEQLGISPTPWTKDGDIVDDGEGRVIFNAYEDDDYANARLIAAAPDMYKTEYDLVNVIERLMNGWAGTCDTPPQDEVVAAIEAAKNALYKAAGESEVNR